MTANTEPLERGPVATDRDLLLAARSGDQAAFAALVRRHERLVHGYLRARLGVATDIDDLCQEVFVRLYAGQTTPAATSSDSGLRPWLVGIARNVLREHVRATKRRENAWTELCLELEARGEEAGSDAGLFDDVIARLPVCLAALGPSARQAIDLYYGGHARLRDVAVQMKRSEGAMKLLVHRARQAVRRCLDTGMPTEATG